MMNWKLVRRIIAGALVCALLGAALGCSSGKENAYSGNIRTMSLQAKKLEKPLGDSEELRTAVSGANNFAFRFAKQAMGDVSQDNKACAPYSMWLPLAALSGAAEETGKEGWMKALGIAGMSDDTLNHAVSQMLYQLNGGDRESALSVHNAIFVDDQAVLQKSFAQRYLDYFRGEAAQLDLQDEQAPDEVNRWFKSKTAGEIEKVVDSFSDDAVAVLCNALYFKDRWGAENEMEECAGIDWFEGSGGIRDASYISTKAYLPYYADKTMQAATLSFSKGAKLTILLPEDGDAGQLFSSLDGEAFRKIQQNMMSREGTIILPEYEIENSMGCIDALKQMGIPMDTGLSGIVENGIVGITQASQSVKFKADLEGVTAAAGTAVETASCAESVPSFYMVCSRPFVFILSQAVTSSEDQVLFIGVVNQP